MWQLVQPPFPKHPILPISQGFDLNQSLYIDQNKIKERKEKANQKNLEQNQLKIFQYTLYLYFIKVIQYIISPELQQQSFSSVKSQTDIFNIIKSGYLFGQFINIVYDKHNTYEPRPNKIQRQQNWKKIIGVLRQDSALRYEHLFPDDSVFDDETQLNALFFKILEDLIILFLDKREMVRLKEFTQQLFLQNANKRNLTEDQTKQMLADTDFPIYLSEKLQQNEYAVNKPIELQSSMQNYLNHYGVPNTLFNNDENWRNGYYFYILIKEIIFHKFKVQFSYKQQNIQYKSLSMTQSISQNKQQLSLHQIVANLSNICDFFNQNQITQNMSVYDLQNGGYNIYQQIIQNIMKQYPYLRSINSQYDEAEIRIVKQKIVKELLWYEIIDKNTCQQFQGNIFSYITDQVRLGALQYDYIEHLFNIGAVKSESISSFFQSQPYVNKTEPEQFNKQIIKYIQDIMKLTSKYTHFHIISASEELAVDFLEQLIMYKYKKFSEVPKGTQNLNKFMLQYYEQYSLFLEHPIEKKQVAGVLIEEQDACILGNNNLYIDGINVDGLQMTYLQQLDYDFLL